MCGCHHEGNRFPPTSARHMFTHQEEDLWLQLQHPTAEPWKDRTLGPDRAGFQLPILIYTDVRYSVFSTAVQTNEIPNFSHHCQRAWGGSGVAAPDLTFGWKHPEEARQASVEHRTDPVRSGFIPARCKYGRSRGG